MAVHRRWQTVNERRHGPWPQHFKSKLSHVPSLRDFKAVLQFFGFTCPMCLRVGVAVSVKHGIKLCRKCSVAPKQGGNL